MSGKWRKGGEGCERVEDSDKYRGNREVNLKE